jgi:predicted nucleic acid-binding protein
MADPLYLLDTNIILQLVRANEFGKYLARSFGLLDLVYRPLVSIVTHGELWAIADRNNWGQPKLATLSNALNHLVTVDLNHENILQSYVQVSRVCRNHQGGARALSDNDLWIAATARAADAVLLTTDKDFLPLQGRCCSLHFINQEHFQESSSRANPSA